MHAGGAVPARSRRAHTVGCDFTTATVNMQTASARARITGASPSAAEMEACVARFPRPDPTHDYVDAGISSCERTTWRMLGLPIALLAALSKQTNFSVGCYCEHESHCHRSVLRELLTAQGALLSP